MYCVYILIVFFFVNQFLFLTQCSISIDFIAPNAQKYHTRKHKEPVKTVSHPHTWRVMDWSSSSRVWARAVVPARLCVAPAVAVVAGQAGTLALLPVPGDLGAGGAVVPLTSPTVPTEGITIVIPRKTPWLASWKTPHPIYCDTKGLLLSLCNGDDLITR